MVRAVIETLCEAWFLCGKRQSNQPAGLENGEERHRGFRLRSKNGLGNPHYSRDRHKKVPASFFDLGGADFWYWPSDGFFYRDKLSESILAAAGFERAEVDNIFAMLQSKGGCCDCEVLYNVAETSRLKANLL
jgi:uncharacterized protein DUF2695